MNIQIISDLHLDFSDNLVWAYTNLKPIADTLLIAGDTCEYKRSLREQYHDKFFSQWKTVIEVPGNHDYYGFHAIEEHQKHCYEMYGSNHHYVNNDYVDLSDVRIICSTLWTKISPHNHQIIKRGMSDYSAIYNYTIEENNRNNEMSVAFLKRTLESSKDKKCIVLTHHLPLWNTVNERYKDHELNEAYANDMTEIITDYNDIIHYWVHGHSHDHIEKKCGNTTCIRNPVGYIKYNEGRDYKHRMIEI